MKSFALAAFLVLCCLAPAAHAQIDTCGDDGGCTFDRDYSDVQQNGGGGGIDSCIRNDGCWTCSVSTRRCVLVSLTGGACECQNVPAGSPNITNCTPAGQCMYRS